MISQRFLDLLDEMKRLHKVKNDGYSGVSNPDTWANFRGSERLGVPAWKGAMIRWQDKVTRVINLVQETEIDHGDEALEDTLLDLASYCLIVICLREELEQKRKNE